jgi:hypothetical protein
MKNLYEYSAILFLALVGLSSCNPADEDQLGPTNVSGISIEEANSLLQGVWYIDRTEEYTVLCANGQLELSAVNVNNLNYSNYKFEFSNSASSGMASYIGEEPNVNTVNLGYGGGGDYTFEFATYVAESVDVGFNNPFSPIDEGSLGLAFFGEDPLLSSLPFFFAWGGEIVEIDSDSFTIQVTWNNKVYRAVFKRSNVSSEPFDISQLSGAYQLSSKTTFSNGVLSSQESFTNVSLLQLSQTLNNSLFPHNPMYNAEIISDIDNVDINGIIDISQGYSSVGWTSTSDYLNLNNHAYRIESFSSNSLVIRDYYSCNSYSEYAFIKIN